MNAHTYILIISILSLGINKTTNVFVFLLSTIFFVVGGLFFSHLTFLFETVKLGMILSTSSNVLNYYKNQYVCSLYLWISFYIYSSLVCLSKSLKLIRLQTSNIDSDMAHKLGIRIFIIALCAGCVFLIIMGHRHIRRFIHKPLKFN